MAEQTRQQLLSSIGSQPRPTPPPPSAPTTTRNTRNEDEDSDSDMSDASELLPAARREVVNHAMKLEAIKRIKGHLIQQPGAKLDTHERYPELYSYTVDELEQIEYNLAQDTAHQNSNEVTDMLVDGAATVIQETMGLPGFADDMTADTRLRAAIAYEVSKITTFPPLIMIGLRVGKKIVDAIKRRAIAEERAKAASRLPTST